MHLLLAARALAQDGSPLPPPAEPPPVQIPEAQPPTVGPPRVLVLLSIPGGETMTDRSRGERFARALAEVAGVSVELGAPGEDQAGVAACAAASCSRFVRLRLSAVGDAWMASVEEFDPAGVSAYNRTRMARARDVDAVLRLLAQDVADHRAPEGDDGREARVPKAARPVDSVPGLRVSLTRPFDGDFVTSPGLAYQHRWRRGRGVTELDLGVVFPWTMRLEEGASLLVGDAGWSLRLPSRGQGEGFAGAGGGVRIGGYGWASLGAAGWLQAGYDFGGPQHPYVQARLELDGIYSDAEIPGLVAVEVGTGFP
jgi:hypothetical protein